MSLDYQRTTYRQSRSGQLSSRQRTTYGNMNQWQTSLSEHKPIISNLDYPENTDPVHLQYTKSGGYDDFHRSFLKLQKDAGRANGFPALGPPRLRNGKAGSSWRHVKEVLQAGGKRIVFVDGTPSQTDMVALKNQSVPLGNSIHKVALFPSRLYAKKLLLNQAKQMPSYELRAFKGTEGNNWTIMR